MNEIKILKEFVTKKEELTEIENFLYESNSDQVRKYYLPIVDILNQEIKNLKIKLSENDNFSESKQSRINLIYQFEQYKIYIENDKSNLGLSRKQGLITENELFIDILDKITEQMTYSNYGIHIPQDLKYASEPKDSINKDELIIFIANEINILRNMFNINYKKLWDYREEFIERTIRKFIN